MALRRRLSPGLPFNSLFYRPRGVPIGCFIASLARTGSRSRGCFSPHRARVPRGSWRTLPERLPLQLVLGGTLGQKVVAYCRTIQKEAVPGLADGGDDALLALDANVHLLHALGTVVDENSADGHDYPPENVCSNRIRRLESSLSRAGPTKTRKLPAWLWLMCWAASCGVNWRTQSVRPMRKTPAAPC